MKIDIAMTATRRPEIIRRTLDSFFENVFNTADDFRLIINIDPIGLSIDSQDVIDVVYEYFDDVIINLPEKADFCTAFRYVLSRAETDLVFHLQDDWAAIRPVDLNRMIKILLSDSRLALLRLSMFPSMKDQMVNWKVSAYPWDGQYFKCPPLDRKRLGFCGHPSLIKREFLKKTIPLMDKRHNPENQFHSYFRVANECERWDYGVFIEQNSTPNILDIGREWMGKNNWVKNNDKSHTVWNTRQVIGNARRKVRP